MAKPYMPLEVGNWLKGTRGMRAEAKGVYIGLLLHQHENGYIPEDLEELTLIEPEVGKVWDKLKEKFVPHSPGKLHNLKLVEVLAYWNKQANNGSKGGRPPKAKPNQNPNGNHHNDLDIDLDLASEGKEVQEETIDQRLDAALVDTYLEPLEMKAPSLYPGVDFKLEMERFRQKVKGSPRVYAQHDTGGLRLAFEHQLRNAKPTNGQAIKKKLKTDWSNV